MRMEMTVDGLEQLRQHALKIGTLEHWSEMAIDAIRQLAADRAEFKQKFETMVKANGKFVIGGQHPPLDPNHPAVTSKV